MITVRFPSGFSVQYNDLDRVDFRSTGAYLGKKKNPNTYNVWAPLECIIEHISPCRTYNASGPSSDLRAEVEALRKQVASLSRKLKKNGQVL